MPYYLDNAFPAERPVDHRGRLRRDGRLRGRGPLPPLPGAGRPPSSWSTTTRWSPTTCCARIFTPRTWEGSRARPSPTGWPGPTGVPSATRSTPSGRRTPSPDGRPLPRPSLTTGTPCSSAAPTTPPHGRAMAECLPGDPRRWLIDAGNDTNWGQVLIGNVADRDFGDEQAFAGETCSPAARAHGAAARPADGGVDQTAGRGLRGGPRPHRPGPDHQPDDGVAGLTGGPPHGGGNLPLHGPVPGHGAGHGHPHLRHPGGGAAGGQV